MPEYINYYDLRESKMVRSGNGSISADQRIYSDNTSEVHDFSEYFDSYTKRMENAKLKEKIFLRN